MIGIQASRFSDEIHAGTLNKTQTMFTGTKQDVTNQVLEAVAPYAINHFGGAVDVELGPYKIRIVASEGDPK